MKANTEEMVKIANEINNYANTYQSMINSFYNKIANLANSNAWSGDSSKKYAELALLDKPGMLNVGDRLRSFSKYIKEMAVEFEGAVNKSESENNL